MVESSGNRESSGPEEILVDEDSLQRAATDLFEQHRDEILRPDHDRRSIARALEQFPDEVLHGYWGHGVTRGGEIGNLAAALSMLQHNAFIGSSARLAGSGYVDAWSHGDFLALSKKDAMLSPSLANNKPQRVAFKFKSGQVKYGLRMDLGALVVSDQFVPIIESMRMMFPQANIIPAAELANYINSV